MALADLVVRLTAETASFTSGMNNAVGELEKFNAKVSGVITSVKNFAGAAGITMLAGGLAEFASKAVDAAEKVIDVGMKTVESMDHINKLSQSTGIAVDQLTKMSYSARLADVDIDSMAKGVEKFSKAVGQAYDSGQKSFRGIAIVDPKTGNMRETSDMILDVTKKFAGMKDGAQKTAEAMQLFGKSGAELIPWLNTAPDDMKRYADEAERLHLVFGKDVTQSAEEFNDNLQRMSEMTQGFANVVVSQVIPGFARYTDELVRSGGQNNVFAETAYAAATAVQGVVIAVDGVITGLRELHALNRGVTGTILGTAMGIPGMVDPSAFSDAEKIRNDFYKRTAALLTGKATPQSNQKGSGSSDRSESLSKTFITAENEVRSILQRIAKENGDTVKVVMLQFDEMSRKIQDAFDKAPGLRQKFPTWFGQLQEAKNTALDKAVSDAREASDKAFGEYMKNAPVPQLPSMPTALPVNGHDVVGGMLDRFNSDLQAQAQAIQSALTPLQQYTFTMGQLDAIAKDIDPTAYWSASQYALDRMNQQIDELMMQTKTAQAGAYVFFRQYAEYAKDSATQIHQVFSNAFAGVEDAFAAMVVDGKNQFGELAKSIARDFVKMDLRQNVLGPAAEALNKVMPGMGDFLKGKPDGTKSNPLNVKIVDLPAGIGGMVSGGYEGGFSIPGIGKLAGAIGGLFGKSSKGPGVGLDPNWFDGFFATGGDVQAGHMYMVGEQGPEPFIPGASGHVFPNSVLKGGGGGASYYIDARGSNAADVEMRVQRAIAEAHGSAVRDANIVNREQRQRGPAYRRNA